jgi:hypothetical protein
MPSDAPTPWLRKSEADVNGLLRVCRWGDATNAKLLKPGQRPPILSTGIAVGQGEGLNAAASDDTIIIIVTSHPAARWK